MAEDYLISMIPDTFRKKSRLYYELHLTLEAGDDFNNFLKICQSVDWRGSRFDQDEVDAYHGKWFASQRCEYEDDIKLLLKDAILTFEKEGYSVIRWKAEDTLFDSKYGDSL